MEKQENNISRRTFIKSTALAGVALTIPVGLEKAFTEEPGETSS